MSVSPIYLRPMAGRADTLNQLRRLLHLAGVIDLKRDKWECSLSPARRAQIESQLQLVTEEFQREYGAFLRATEPHREKVKASTPAGAGVVGA